MLPCVCIEDDKRKVGVKAYLLKKITSDLPLHHIPVALKWDHLFNLKLVESDYATSAHISLLPGSEVFTRITHGGQRTGPQGRPTCTSINICFGWMPFGNIQGNDVLEVAICTLEQDIMRELTRTRRSFPAVHVLILCC